MPGGDVPDDAAPAVARLLQVLASLRDDAVRGAALTGSSVAGGLRPDSDVDLLVVVDGPLPDEDRRALLAELMRISGRRATAPVGPRRPPRPIELTVVALQDVVPWHHPARHRLRWGEWLREEAEAGAPLGPMVDPDLTVVLAQALRASGTLAGADVSALLDAVPNADVRVAMAESIPGLLHDLAGDERNVILTLARMEVTAATSDIVPKDVAADRLLARGDLDPEARAVLRAARDAYRSSGAVDWAGLDAAGVAADAAARIRAVLRPPARVRLVPVDESVLAALTAVAAEEADADEVTPPLGDGPGWNPEQWAWFHDFHRDRRPGLDGPLGEATRAVVVEGRPVGSVRLQRTEVAGVLETGIWLARCARGGGVGVAALRAVLAEAAASGAVAVRATTTARNGAARAALARAGFVLAAPDAEGSVRARIDLPRSG